LGATNGGADFADFAASGLSKLMGIDPNNEDEAENGTDSFFFGSGVEKKLAVMAGADGVDDPKNIDPDDAPASFLPP
jgi:hypothetical protein